MCRYLFYWKWCYVVNSFSLANNSEYLLWIWTFEDKCWEFQFIKELSIEGENNRKHCHRMFSIWRWFRAVGTQGQKDWLSREWGGLPAGCNLQEGEWELVNEADLARLKRDGKNTGGRQEPGQSSQIHLHLDLQILSIAVTNIMRDHLRSLK